MKIQMFVLRTVDDGKYVRNNLASWGVIQSHNEVMTWVLFPFDVPFVGQNPVPLW